MKAVCLRCGSFKNNAWKRCGECNYRPVGDEEKAQHLLLSSHFNKDKKLQEFADHIKEGKEVDFKDKDLEMVTEVLKNKFQSQKNRNKYIFKLAGSFCLTIILMVIFYFIKAKK
jgi:hypothetical protein